MPQIRERVFIFGTKSDKNFQFPKSSIGGVGKLKSFKNVGEAINDLSKKDTSFQNHIILNHSETVVSRYKLYQRRKLPSPEKLPKEIRRSNFEVPMKDWIKKSFKNFGTR